MDEHDALVDAGFLLAAVEDLYKRSYGSAWVAFSDPAWTRTRSAANKLRKSLDAKAIEARRAETLGSVEDESAVPKGIRPNPVRKELP